MESHRGMLGDNLGFVQMITGTYESDKPIKITGLDKNHLKADCINGSKVNGVRGPILYSFASDKSPGHKICEEPRIKLFKKVNKSVLSHITFYLEDDDYKPVDFSNRTINSTCLLVKK